MANTTQDIDAEIDPAATAAESEAGLENNVAGALAYLFGFITGLVFFLIKKNDRFVRWHAAQSMAFSGLLVVAYVALTVIQIFFTAVMFSGSGGGFILGSLLSLVLWVVWLAVALGGFVAWIYLMIKAYQGDTPRLPVAAGIADRLA